MKGIAISPEMNEARRAGFKSITRRIKKNDVAPYKVGEVLYVREATRVIDILAGCLIGVEYKDGQSVYIEGSEKDLQRINSRKRPAAWLPGRYMMKIFARDYVRITGIRFERLRAITESDAIREGILMADGFYLDYNTGFGKFKSAVSSFRSLWEKIHGSGTWSINPEVWVIEFENCEKP